MAKKYTAQCAYGGAFATFFGVPDDDFTLLRGQPKSFHYMAESGNGLDRNFCPECGARLFTTNLDSFPATVFVTIGSLDRPELIAPVLEMFTKRRLKWTKPPTSFLQHKGRSRSNASA